MVKLLKSRNSVLVMLLVAVLALGGMVGCASDSGSTTTTTTTSGGADASSQSESGGDCTGGSLDACKASCDTMTGSDKVDCLDICYKVCLP